VARCRHASAPWLCRGQFGKGEFFLVPHAESGPITENEPAIGVLGLNVFGKVDFELDFANAKLNLYSQDHCPGVVVYWTDKYSSARITQGPLGNYYFPMELDGRKIESTITTITDGNSITTDVTKHLYNFDEKSEGIETETDPTGRSQSHYRAMALTGDGIKITNARMRLVVGKLPNCSLTSSHGSERAAVYEGCMGGEAPLKLGLSVARHLHLYFATKEKVLYFSDASASK
jgi:hypothetical protein